MSCNEVVYVPLWRALTLTSVVAAVLLWCALALNSVVAETNIGRCVLRYYGVLALSRVWLLGHFFEEIQCWNFLCPGAV